MHLQSNFLSDYAEILKLIAFVVFLFWVIKVCKFEKMNNINCHGGAIERSQFDLVQQTYSPDLTSSDYNLFPKIKKESYCHFSYDLTNVRFLWLMPISI